MASPFATAGLGQFGQDSNYQSGAGGGFLAGLAVKKSGLEDYLNKNLGVSYEGGKLAPVKPPTSVVAPVAPIAPAVPTATDNVAQPMGLPSLQNAATGIVDSISTSGHDILNAGKSFIGGLLN